MNKKKVLSFLLVAAIAGTTLGCSSVGTGGSAPQGASSSENSQTAKNVEINFASWSSSDASTNKVFMAMFKNYEDSHPGVKIKDTSVPYNQFLEQMLIMASGGSAPDAAQIHGSMLSTLVSSGALEPLDDLISQEAKDDFLPNALEPLIYDGKMMATPWSPSPDALYYNKTLLNKAGYQEPPKTWAEMKEMSEKIAKLGKDENGNKIYGLGIATKKLAGTGYGFLPYLWANGGDISDKDGKVTLDTPEVVKAFAEMKDLLANEVSPSGLEVNDLRNLFAQGQLGFIFDGDYGFSMFAENSPKGQDFLNEIDAAIPPENMSVFYEHDLGVFADSKIKKEAAEFIEYLSGPEAMQLYNDNGLKTPGRKSVRKLEQYKPENNKNIQVFLNTLDVSRGFPQKNSGFIKGMEDLAEAMQRVSINNEEPAVVAKELHDKISALYDK